MNCNVHFGHSSQTGLEKSTPFILSVTPLYLYRPWQAGQVTPSPCIFREHHVTTLLILHLVRREGYVVGLLLHPQSTRFSWEGEGGRKDWKAAPPIPRHPVEAGEESTLAPLLLATKGALSVWNFLKALAQVLKKPCALLGFCITLTQSQQRRKKKLGRRANSFPKDPPLNDADSRPLLLSMPSTCLTGVHLRKEKTSYRTSHPAKHHQ